MKLQASATLFALVSPPASVFERLLEASFGGVRDEETIRLLRLARGPIAPAAGRPPI